MSYGTFLSLCLFVLVGLAKMGAARALVTVRMGITYVNDGVLAAQHLAELRMACQPFAVDDEIMRQHTCRGL